jgi:hypothetical protein
MINDFTRVALYIGKKDRPMLEKLNKLQLIHNLTRTQLLSKMMTDQANLKGSIFYESLNTMN